MTFRANAPGAAWLAAQVEARRKVMRADRTALNTLAALVDHALHDCPRGRRLVMATVDRATVRELAQEQGIADATLVSRLHRSEVPRVETENIVWRLRVSHMVQVAGVTSGLVAQRLGVMAPQHFARASFRIMGVWPGRGCHVLRALMDPETERAHLADWLARHRGGFLRLEAVSGPFYRSDEPNTTNKRTA